MTGPPVRRAAVLGAPISHSLSPVLHRAAYSALGLTGWDYTAHRVTEAELPGFLADLGGEWAGLSLTMPLKAAVLPLLDAASPVVEVVGAANTVLLRDGRRVGDNTDVPGMVAALSAGPDRPVEVPYAAVLGGGATARSALAALAAVTADVRAYVRTPARATELTATAEAVGLRLTIRPWAGAAEALSAPLVVNTTPAGAADALVAQTPTTVGTLFEVLYEPWPTPLAAAWTARGGPVVDGLELLVQQAVLQVGLMTGADVEGAGTSGLTAVMRSAGERELRTT